MRLAPWEATSLAHGMIVPSSGVLLFSCCERSVNASFDAYGRGRRQWRDLVGERQVHSSFYHTGRGRAAREILRHSYHVHLHGSEDSARGQGSDTFQVTRISCVTSNVTYLRLLLRAPAQISLRLLGVNKRMQLRWCRTRAVRASGQDGGLQHPHFTLDDIRHQVVSRGGR